jgi:hypothetical protein
MPMTDVSDILQQEASGSLPQPLPGWVHDLAVMVPRNDTDAAVDRAHEGVPRALGMDGHCGGRDFD